MLHVCGVHGSSAPLSVRDIRTVWGLKQSKREGFASKVCNLQFILITGCCRLQCFSAGAILRRMAFCDKWEIRIKRKCQIGKNIKNNSIEQTAVIKRKHVYCIFDNHYLKTKSVDCKKRKTSHPAVYYLLAYFSISTFSLYTGEKCVYNWSEVGMRVLTTPS